MDDEKTTIPDMLRHWATHQSHTAAFIFLDSAGRRRLLTRADCYRLAARYAAILRRCDIGRGDIVCNTLVNSPERVISDFGILLAGATSMNGQLFLADGEDLKGDLRDSACKAVIVDPDQPRGAAPVLASLHAQHMADGTVRIPEYPALRRILHCRLEESQGEMSNFLDMLEVEQDSYEVKVAADDVAYIWNTSGSTGFSKLIEHTHRRILRFGVQACVVHGLIERSELAKTVETIKGIAESVQVPTCAQLTDATTAEDEGTTYAAHITFINGKLGWSGGFPGDFFITGATRVMLDLSKCFPDDTAAMEWQLARQERCTNAFFLPFRMQQIVCRPELWRELPWRFHSVNIAGQPVYKDLVKNAIEKVTDRVLISYGSSEFGYLTCNAVIEPESYESCNNGKPMPGVSLKVMNEERSPEALVTGTSSSSAPNFRMGEIIVKTTAGAPIYISNEEASRKMLLADGWCRTGDMGYVDPEGNVYVICRTSFAIMRGAYVVYPEWLEARINAHPAVRNVLVVPVPDPVLHQELCACVETKTGMEVTEEELRQFSEGLLLTEKSDHVTVVPRYFLFFPTLPTTPTGKPCRRSTRAVALARMGLHSAHDSSSD